MITLALLYTFREPEMFTAGLRVLLIITGPGPFLFILKLTQGSGPEGDDVL